jgi:acyl-CoA synthetase (AMP-forming)/AMP-acid ligase II
MYPGTYAARTPDRIAAVMAGTGQTVSYGELERRSAQLAHVLHDGGLRPGDVVALLTENSLRALEVLWAALRSGLYITAVNYRLKPDEVAYIVNDNRGRLGHAPGRPAARFHHAVLLRHHRTAQGRAAAAARRPGGRAR